MREYFDHTGPAFIYNLGVSGANTSDLLERFEVEARARRPEVVLFSIGDNDCMHIEKDKNNVPISQFKSNIEKLITLARVYTDKSAFVSLNRVDEKKTMPWRKEEGECWRNKDLKEYNNELQKICAQQKVFFIDTSDVLTESELPD